ncbi:amidohydrolase 2 [Rhizodiscina lignyota]|uniref:Amidohydrolase 2 n=1 Tax=Rhizodiscina lignyota TaxID=1504668 RepID=A0A9P4I9E1_9PEZI|nr:amidohydrolase 2 [Rhizodiscina lignyota]
MVPPLITLEEHFISSSMVNDARYVEQLKWLAALKNQLYDLDKVRLSEMDRGKINLQIISHAPCNPSVQGAFDANNELAQAVKKQPERFKAFAVLPMSNPEEATKELERTVKELGFLGALIDNHTSGTYYDGQNYRSVWKKAEELDVPIYLHPSWPTDEMSQMLYTGNFTAGTSRSLGASGFGWHQDVGVHVLKLFASGLFDEFPKLKLVIGHFGEMLPFMLERICVLSKRWGDRKRVFQTVYDENIFITTSGVWSVNPMATLMRNTKIENILYSVDYPFADNGNGLKFMEDLEKSGLVTKEQFEAIAYKNAEKLLKVKLSS